MTIHEWNGKRSNILVRGPHGAGVFKDLQEENSSRRYKMVFKEPVEKKIFAAFSANGINWSDPVSFPELTIPGDTHNNAFWASTIGKYVLIMAFRENIILVIFLCSQNFQIHFMV